MAETRRKKYEKNVVLWLTVVGVPFAICTAVFSWMGLDLKIWLPVSILVAFQFGLITYLIFLKGDIRDINDEKLKLEKRNNELRSQVNKLKKVIK